MPGGRTPRCSDAPPPRAESPGPAGPRSTARLGLRQHVGRRGQVLLHQDRRDEQGRRVVVEPGAAAAVGGEGVGRMGVDAEQVADRVVVLPAGEPLDQAGAGVADPVDSRRGSPGSRPPPAGDRPRSARPGSPAAASSARPGHPRPGATGRDRRGGTPRPRTSSGRCRPWASRRRGSAGSASGAADGRSGRSRRPGRGRDGQAQQGHGQRRYRSGGRGPLVHRRLLRHGGVGHAARGAGEYPISILRDISRALYPVPIR